MRRGEVGPGGVRCGVTEADAVESGRLRLGYLGPEGSFTHQAAQQWAQHVDSWALDPLPAVADVYRGVGDGTLDRGVAAMENTVEGYVVPSLDAIIAAGNVVAIDEVVLDITFNAFVRPDHKLLTEVTAHPHGLAQCASFIDRSGLRPVPAQSNAAACRDLGAHQVALGPQICGSLYGLETWAHSVADFQGARTRFLVLAPRARAALILRHGVPGALSPKFRTMMAITPTTVGPGVLARITRVFGESGVNLSSLITRPLKAVDGRYVFVLTIDAAPWQMREALTGLMAAGDYVKTLGVLPALTELDESIHAGVDPSQVPVGSVGAASPHLDEGLLW